MFLHHVFPHTFTPLMLGGIFPHFKIIQEFVGLRAKQYSFKMWEDSSEHKRCKGIRKNVVKNRITHDDYKNYLLDDEEQMRNMNVIIYKNCPQSI